MTTGSDEELTFLAIVPRGGGECVEFEVTASPKDTGEKLKKRIEKLCAIPSDDLELFFKNQNVPDAKQKWVYEDATLKDQELYDGAIITVGVHGMRGDAPSPDPETGEMPNDAVNNSIATKGDASYYHAHSRPSMLPEEHRIVSGGAPAKLSGDLVVPLEEPKTLKQQIEESEGRKDVTRGEKPIRNYSWGDEKATIKIYISKDSEPDAISAAEDGKSGQVDVKWGPKYLKLKIKAERHDLVLELDRIYYEIIPEECSFRVSQNKRITLTLKKKESYTWLKLLKPDS
mmetsp:Transcript_126973/g.353637  ORF Transcript_126973/g.353637 Transcript_126973/m.353637 type:complete len:287 (-) Transcript_126973:117-977(-)